MSIFDVIIGASITGLGAGVGSALGNYVAQRALIKQMEKLEKKLLNKRELKRNE